MSPEQIEHLMTLVTRYGDARARQLVTGTDAERDADQREIETLERAIRDAAHPPMTCPTPSGSEKTPGSPDPGRVKMSGEAVVAIAKAWEEESVPLAARMAAVADVAFTEGAAALVDGEPRTWAHWLTTPAAKAAISDSVHVTRCKSQSGCQGHPALAELISDALADLVSRRVVVFRVLETTRTEVARP